MGSRQIFLYPTSNMVGIVLIWAIERVGITVGLQNLIRPFEPDIALQFNKFYIMALFGSDWLDDYDSMKEYECSIIHNEDDESIPYDKPIFAPIHDDEEYDSLKEYERKLH